MSNDNIMDRVERFASTPKGNGHYPTDAECEAYEAELRASNT